MEEQDPAVNFNGLEAVSNNVPILKFIETEGTKLQKHFTDIAKTNLLESDITPVGLKPKYGLRSSE